MAMSGLPPAHNSAPRLLTSAALDGSNCAASWRSRMGLGRASAHIAAGQRWRGRDGADRHSQRGKYCSARSRSPPPAQLPSALSVTAEARWLTSARRLPDHRHRRLHAQQHTDTAAASAVWQRRWPEQCVNRLAKSPTPPACRQVHLAVRNRVGGAGPIERGGPAVLPCRMAMTPNAFQAAASSGRSVTRRSRSWRVRSSPRR